MLAVSFRFGVCCVFVITDSTITISQNCTYIQNPGLKKKTRLSLKKTTLSFFYYFLQRLSRFFDDDDRPAVHGGQVRQQRLLHPPRLRDLHPAWTGGDGGDQRRSVPGHFHSHGENSRSKENIKVLLLIVPYITQVPTGQQIPTICGQNTGQHSKISS